MKQMWQVFQMTRRYDPSSQWLMLLGFLAPVLVGLALALWLSDGNGLTIALWVIAGVLAGPLVRSSYRAGRLWAQSMQAKGRRLPVELAHLADASLGFAQAVG